MESSKESNAKFTTASTSSTTTTTTTTTNNAQQHQSQPSISVSASSSGTSVAATAAVAVAPAAASGSIKRPPPLKATVTSTASSGSSSIGCIEQHKIAVTAGVAAAATLTTPLTPRIELSRASSSSHHEEDSRESSPENVFDQVGTGTLQETIGLGFREEGALELRSSTEELYFMDPEQKREEQEKIQQQQQQAKRSSPHIFKFEDHQTYLQQHQRKDSASSEVAALLCISGRTSRISSVGSQGSAVSRLSAVSGVSRSPSPHRMLLETSFCGPKPLENVVDGSVISTVEPPTAELLEQVLLARKQDPTQAVLAEGIKVESSPKRKPPTSLSNGDTKLAAKIAAQNRPLAGAGTTKPAPSMGTQRRSTKSPGQMVVGKTPSGTEYIRINLKPDHMYDDKGIAPNERLVEAPNTLTPAYSKSQKKPASLSLGRSGMDENRLTPTASPKPTRHSVLSKDSHGSRSPSPATVSVSRKSSFSSLFRFGGGGKDSPDSPRERSRSRSKSKERATPQSQNVTPSKQKSVLAIFKTGKRGSSAGTDTKSSKSSSPIDGHEHQPPPAPPQSRSKSHTPGGSRPASRLRYYDEPVEGFIHIPLHTPPEERETRKVLQGIQQLNAEPRPVSVPITASQLVAAAAALKPVTARKDSVGKTRPSAAPQKEPAKDNRAQRIENLDAIHSLPHEPDNKDERNWSLEVQRHSSQDSQETAGSEASYASAIKVTARSQLANVQGQEQPKQVKHENGGVVAAEIYRLPSVDSTLSTCEAKIVETVATVNATTGSGGTVVQEEVTVREKRRLLFATRLGSGSQEQIFSTQFSISKTESLSSQLSEQMQETIAESPAAEYLQRQDTVIRRGNEQITPPQSMPATQKRMTGVTANGTRRQKSHSTSEDEKPPITVQTTVTALVLRRKDSSEEARRKSRSNSEDDGGDAPNSMGPMSNQRHSRYLENFDVRKKYHENVPRKPKRQSVPSEAVPPPVLPQPPPPSTAPSPSPPPGKTRTPRSQSQSPVDQRARQTPTKPPRNITPTRRSTPPTPTKATVPISITSPPSTARKHQQHINDRQSVHSTDEPVETSESERDSDNAVISGASTSGAAPATAGTSTDAKRRHLPRHMGVIEDHESTGLVSQESFDDELPYIPTTLPEERAHGVALIPMKERANMELKTCSVERPRSTTPLNPSHLEEYCGIVAPPVAAQEGHHDPMNVATPVRGEKLRISLPRKDSGREKAQSAKSPRRSSNAGGGKSWFEFAEEGLRAVGNLERKDSNKQLLPQSEETPRKPEREVTKAMTKTVQSTHVTPTSGSTHTHSHTHTHSTQRKLSGHWIDFENIPEKRKPPKRITALPKDVPTSGTATSAHHHHHHHHGQQPQPDVTVAASTSDGKLHYNYVKPEDCQCECHESKRDTSAASGGTESGAASGSKSITSVDLLQQGEDMLPLLDPDTHDGIEPSDSSREYSCYTDDEADVPLQPSGSSRHKNNATKLDEFPRRDVSHSPRNRKFPDNRK